MWPFGKSAKARLEEALADQKLTSELDLDVEVRRKVAYVSGEVPNDRYLNLVRAMASGINGLDDVDVSGLKPRVTVTPGGAAQGAQADADPAEEQVSAAEARSGMVQDVLSKIRSDATLAKNPIDVVAKGDTLILRGAIDSEAARARAAEVASAAAGGADVDTRGLQVVEHASDLNVTDDDGDVVYTVESGDTLSAIALHYYGSAGRSSYMKIAEANDLDDPNKIYVGQKLKIPGTADGPDAVLG